MYESSSLNLIDQEDPQDIVDNYNLDITEDSNVFSNGNNLSTRSTSNISDVIASSYDPKKSYYENDKSSAIYGCYAAETSIPPTSDVEPICFPSCNGTLLPEDYKQCNHTTWQYLEEELERLNDVKSKEVILIVDDKDNIPRYVYMDILDFSDREYVKLNIYIKKHKCIQYEFWKVIDLNRKYKKSGSSVPLIILIIILFLFLLGILYLFTRRK